MSKRFKLLIFVLFSTTAIFIYQSLKTEKSSNSESLVKEFSNHQKSSISIKSNQTSTNTDNEEKTLIDNNKPKFEIDLQLSEDLVQALMTKNQGKRLSEIIRLADAYPDNLLLQYLAATNCLRKQQLICDSNKFTQRLLIANPNSATAKSFLAAMNLKNEDSESVLAELSKIKATDTYSSFFYETTQSLEPAFKEKFKEK